MIFYVQHKILNELINARKIIYKHLHIYAFLNVSVIFEIHK